LTANGAPSTGVALAGDDYQRIETSRLIDLGATDLAETIAWSASGDE
jgi:hypothetical protein